MKPLGLDFDAIAKPYVDKMNELVTRLDTVIRLLEDIKSQGNRL